MKTRSIEGQQPFATPTALLSGPDRFERYIWNRKKAQSTDPLPPLMHIGDASEAMELLAPEDLIVQEPYALPYTALHPFLKHLRIGEQRSLIEAASVSVVEAPYNPKGLAELLFEFSAKSQPTLGLKKSDSTACLDGLVVSSGKLHAKIGCGAYEESYFTMNSQGLIIDPSRVSNHPELAGHVLRKFGNVPVSVRKVVHESCRGLPDFGSQFARYVIGVAAIVTTSDNMFVLSVRGQRTSFYRGSINVTTSGGVNFSRDSLGNGFSALLKDSLIGEAKDELGISIGYSDIELLGAAREVSRAGSPEFLYRIRYPGTMTEFLEAVSKNTHPESEEIAGLHFFNLGDLKRLLSSGDTARRIHHKALLALHFMIL